MLKHQNITDTRCSKAYNLRMIPCHFFFVYIVSHYPRTHVGFIDLTTTNEIAKLIRFRQSHRIRIHRRATRVGAFEVFEAAHVALRTLLAFSQPVNCIFWPIGMLNWLVAASKLHKHRVTCCAAEWLFYVFLFYARAMPTTNPRTGMLWERDCAIHRSSVSFAVEFVVLKRFA